MSIIGTVDPTPALAAPVLCLVRDLIFAAKITATARGMGVAVRVLRDPAVLDCIDGPHLFADLNQPGTIVAAARWRTRTGRAVTGFVAHVDADTAAAARAAGIDRVLARSAFASHLPDLLRTAAAGPAL